METWQRTVELARKAGLGDADMAGLAIGCPRHGNASMDFDDAGVFCSRCDIEHTMAKRDAVQDARTAALDELAAENGITRGDAPESCITCGLAGGELTEGVTGRICADAMACEDRFTAAR